MREGEIYEVLKGAGEAGFAIGPDGSIRFWNSLAEKLLGSSAESVHGRYCFEVIQGTSTGSEPVCGRECSVLELARQGKPMPSFDLEASTGALPCSRWVNVSTLVAPTARSYIVIHLVRDINARKRLEQVTRKFLQEVCTLTGHEVEEILASPGPPHSPLTGRERQVLDLLAQGVSTNEIAHDLSISRATVRNHIQHSLVKLHAHSRMEAVFLSQLERVKTSPAASGESSRKGPWDDGARLAKG
jgi:PAS domain S-box-containing protein